MPNLKAHCSMHYHYIHLDTVESFAVGVRDGIYNNDPPFTGPPKTLVQFQALIDNYVNKYGAYKQGGLAQRGPFHTAKNNLMTGLDVTAEFVDGIALGDVNIITLGGYVPTKTGSTDVPAPAQPGLPILKRGVSGEISAECPKVAGAEYYGCIMVAYQPLPSGFDFNGLGQILVDSNNTPGPPTPPPPGPGFIAFGFDMTKLRKKKFLGLEPHVTYYFYFYAANATGVSPLSEVRSIECM